MSDKHAKSEDDAIALTVTIDPLVQQPARWSVQFYWLVVSTSFSLYLFLYYLYSNGVNPPGIELGFYPMLFASGCLAKSFFWRKIPEMFRRLVQLGTLRAEVLNEILGRFQHRLDHPLGNLVGIVFGLVILVFYFLGLPQWGTLRMWPVGFLMIHFSIVAIDGLLGYTIGVVIWKLVVTATEIRRLAEQQSLKLQPFHPDRCQGLSPIGSLTLAISQILAVFAFFFLAFIFYNRELCAKPSDIYLHFEPWFLLGLMISIGITIAAFVWPLVLIHRIMQVEADRAGMQLDELASRISMAEQSMIRKNFELGDAEIKEEEAKIAVLKRLLQQHGRVATWPIDLSTYSKFFAVQIPLCLGMLSTAWNLMEKMRGGH